MSGEFDQYNKVSESIKLIFDLTSRIDERVKILVEQHNETSERIEKLHERHEAMLNRIIVLENKNGSELKHMVASLKERMEEIDNGRGKLEFALDTQKQIADRRIQEMEVKMATLEVHNDSHANKWKMAGEFVFKVILLGIGAFLTWKLSLK